MTGHFPFWFESGNAVNCVTTVGSLEKAPHACQRGAILQVGPTQSSIPRNYRRSSLLSLTYLNAISDTVKHSQEED
ncbi:unnamed protein product [Sphenostylis stenocarpa]|uniref:Uncharacterized protein n=1 Tax=Sphenostylis stenocarpa TaxID=92480 RepID=A0AA86S6P3_9FABA|nr:unnamed protein product [Sphenostylis stenocarpa]